MEHFRHNIYDMQKVSEQRQPLVSTETSSGETGDRERHVTGRPIVFISFLFLSNDDDDDYDDDAAAPSPPAAANERQSDRQI